MAFVTTFDYAEHFWGEKHHGYHVLYERLKASEESTQELNTFLKERISGEEDVAKNLSKALSRLTAYSTSSNGTFAAGWMFSKGTMEVLIEIHNALLTNIQELSKETQKYQEELVKSRKKAKEQDVIDAVNLMQTTTTCLQKAKETYASRAAEVEKLRKETNPNVKELNKAETKLLRARDEYRGYVEKFEVVRVDFVEKMQRAARTFQAHDRAHLSAMKQFLLKYARHVEEAGNASTQVFAQLRESVDALNVEDLLVKFVAEKGTGREPPQSVAFEEIDVSGGVAVSSSLLGGSDDLGIGESSLGSAPSSSASSAVVPGPPKKVELTANDLLSLDPWSMPPTLSNSNVIPQGSPTASDGSSSSSAQQPTLGNGGTQPEGGMGTVSNEADFVQQRRQLKLKGSFSASLGGSRGKLSMFMPRRKKNNSLPSEEPPTSEAQMGGPSGQQGSSGGGFLKLRYNRKNKKSLTDVHAASASEPTVDKIQMDDARSTASSSNNDDKWNGSMPMDLPYAPPPPLPRQPPPGIDFENLDDKTHWSCSSSEDEEESEMQKSRIRGLQIRPADAAKQMNASVDELRDAIGNINLGSGKGIERSSTFDKDPWTSRPFSQSFGGGSLKPLRPAYTGDEHLRKKMTDGGAPFSFSSSLSSGTFAAARPRPRSNTPTLGMASLTPMGHSTLVRKESGDSEASAWPRSESVNSLGDANFTPSTSSFALSSSTLNLAQATISEQRVPVAMALNEYAHAWFRGSNTDNRTLRVFGTALVSFAASSLPLLTDTKNDVEPLKFQISNAEVLKAVLPNKQLLVPNSVKIPASTLAFAFDRLGLANWLLQQQKDMPTAAFYNAEVLRYELSEAVKEPPLLFCTYWKVEDGQTDIRVDYRLNSAAAIQSALLNVIFEIKLETEVANITAEPHAELNPTEKKLTWTLTELSRHGEGSGSLKARLNHAPGTRNKPDHTTVQFQASDASLSHLNLVLESSDFYHLSLVRRKVISGKYFCDPEVRT